MLQERHDKNILLDVTYQTVYVIASHMWSLVVHGTIAGRELKMSHTGSLSIRRDPLLYWFFTKCYGKDTNFNDSTYTQNKTCFLLLLIRYHWFSFSYDINLLGKLINSVKSYAFKLFLHDFIYLTKTMTMQITICSFF